MKLAFSFLVLSFAVLTTEKQSLRDTDIWSLEKNNLDSNLEDKVKIVPAGFDFKGNLKRSLAMSAALENADQNLVCSPISALLPLGKLVLGTERGTSREELLKAIGATKDQVKNRFKSLLNGMQYLSGVTLSVASRLFVSNTAHLSSQYHKLAESVFKSSCEKLDFKSPSSSAGIINRWVSDQTKGMIPRMLSPSDILPDSSVIIVNAVYFGGMWKDRFRNVALGNFKTPRGVRQVPMMTRADTYNYGYSNTLGSQIIEIPYADEKASFVIVLPEERSGLTLLLQQLKVAPELLNNAMANMNPTSIELTIPKFRVQSELNLNTLYQKIGIKEVFRSTNSGLTRIVHQKTLFITRAIQKAVIEVTEKGTEASAATGVIIGYLSSPKTFVANRPFLFFIKVNQEQLFAGILTEP